MDATQWWRVMTDVEKSKRRSFAPLVKALVPVLAGRPPKIIAIGGLPSSGKTSLGRYLAWRFNSTLIETDLLRTPGDGFGYRYNEFARMIAHNIDRRRPVIVEGVFILRLLAAVKRKHDFLIHVTSKAELDREHPLMEEAQAYELKFDPTSRADWRLNLKHQG